jgi:hypothetical protein
MNSTELAELLHRSLVDRGVVATCWSCIEFSRDNETCAKAGHTRPPLETIMFGCKFWDDIPF